MKLNKKIVAVISSILLLSMLSVNAFASTYSCDSKNNSACTTCGDVTCTDNACVSDCENTTCADNSCTTITTTTSSTCNANGLLNLLLNLRTNSGSTSCGTGTSSMKNLILSLLNR